MKFNKTKYIVPSFLFAMLSASNLLASEPASVTPALAGDTSVTVFPEVSNDCTDQISGDLHWTYCVSKIEGSHNPDIMYFLHGIDGSASDWVEVSKEIRNEWFKEKVDAPTVVSISFGTAWLLAPKSGSELTGLLMDLVINQIIPHIENRLGGLQGRRILTGQSMGGFNATELALWFPKEFERVAVICPALTELSPFATDEEFAQFISRENASSEKVYRARGLAQYLFGNQTKWDSVSPFVQGPVLLSSSSPKLFLSVGRQDDYGFFKGVEAYAKLAQSKGVNTQWVPVEGKHCSYDAVALAKFLVNP